MKTSPFHTNHFGLYTGYNSANKRYVHEPFKPIEPEARLTGQFKSPRSSMEETLYKDRILRVKMQGATQKAFSPVETAQ